MGKAPIFLLNLIPLLLKAMFKAEKSKKPGKEKKQEVIDAIAEPIVKSSSSSDLGKYFSLVFRLIEAFVKIFNDVFGKNGWGEVDNDPKNGN